MCDISASNFFTLAHSRSLLYITTYDIHRTQYELFITRRISIVSSWLLLAGAEKKMRRRDEDEVSE